MCLAHHWSSIQRIQSAPSTKTTACFVVSYPTHSGLLGTQTIPCFHPPLLLLLLLLFSYSICWMLDGRITFPSHRDFATVSLQGSHFFPSVGICSGIRKYVFRVPTDPYCRPPARRLRSFRPLFWEVHRRCCLPSARIPLALVLAAERKRKRKSNSFVPSLVVT